MSETLNKYPMQCAVIKRKNLTLGVDVALSVTNGCDKKSPLMIHDGYSRMVLSLVDNTGEQTVVPVANIPATDIAYIMKMTDMAMEKVFNAKTNISQTPEEQSTATTSAAYTQILQIGTFKGKTPADVLLENPSNLAELKKQKAFLESKLSQFSANALPIKAIEDAINLYEIDALEKPSEPVVNTATFDIYQSPVKPRSKKDENGRNLVYSIGITCTPSNKYPFTITIFNCYAPVITKTGGTINVAMSEAVNKCKSSIKLNDMEWYSVISQMDRVVQYYERSYFAPMYKLARQYSYQHSTSNNTNMSES